MAINKLTEKHVEQCAKIVAETPLWERYGHTFDTAKQMFVSHVNNPSQLIDVLCNNGQVQGFVWYNLKGAFFHSGYIRLIGVHPNVRGQSIGAELLTHAENIAKNHSNHMFLLVSDFNINAQRFYQRHGYRKAGSLSGYILPDVAELIFWKVL